MELLLKKQNIDKLSAGTKIELGNNKSIMITGIEVRNILDKWHTYVVYDLENTQTGEFYFNEEAGIEVITTLSDSGRDFLQQ